MKNSLILILKGYVMGTANLIPGVSGGTLAITLGIYEKFIDALSHLFKKFKENVKFLIPVLIGIILALFTLSKAMVFCLNNYLFITIMFFIGAILGGLPMLTKKVKGKRIGIIEILVFATAFVVVLVPAFLSGEKVISFEQLRALDYILLFFVGMLASITMVVPGVSGSAVLMTIGYYKPIVNTIKNLTNSSNDLGKSIIILLIFGVGVIVGMLFIAKIIEYFLKHFEVKTYYGIIGFVIASVVAIIYQNFFAGGYIAINVLDIILGIISLAVGFFIALKLGDK